MTNQIIRSTSLGDRKRCLVQIGDTAIYDHVYSVELTDSEIIAHIVGLSESEDNESDSDRVKREIEENTNG